MELLRIALKLCIVIFELKCVLSMKNRSLRKLNERIEVIETNYNKRINDMEIEIRLLKDELDDQRVVIDHLEAKMNLTEPETTISVGEPNGKKRFQ